MDERARTTLMIREGQHMFLLARTRASILNLRGSVSQTSIMLMDHILLRLRLSYVCLLSNLTLISALHIPSLFQAKLAKIQ